MGGDEVFAKCWDFKPSIKEYMNKHNIPNYRALEEDFRIKES